MENIKFSCNFDYNCLMTEQMTLGLAANPVGKKLEYDGKAGHITNAPETNELVKRKYRVGWPLNG